MPGTADVQGPQRKVLAASVAPARPSLGTSGIALKEGRALPFRVTRQWSAPAGHYVEQFFLVDPSTREVLLEGPAQIIHVWGLQGPTELTDVVTEPVELAPGTYQMVFALGGIKGGEIQVEASEAPASEAA